MGALTQTQLTIALPKIIEELNIPVSLGQWLTTIYLLIIGVMIPVTAYLTHRYTSRQLFLTCMSCFCAGSIMAGFSDSFGYLLLGRILQAVGTGILMPLLQIAVLEVVPEEKRSTAMGVVGLTVSFAPAIGPTLAGWLTDQFGWRSNFLVLAAVGVVLVGLAIVFLSNIGEIRPYPLDKKSVALSTVGFGGLLFGFTNIGNLGIGSVLSWPPILVGAVALALFARRQMRLKEPLLELRVFLQRDFLVGTILVSLLYAAFMGVGVVLPVYIQTYRGISAMESGLILLPGAIIMAVTSLLAGVIMDRVGVRRIVITGAVTLLGGTVMLMFLSDTTPNAYIVAAMILRFFGLAAFIMPITVWSLNILPRRLYSDGAAINNTMRQVSGAIGSALMVTVMTLSQRLVSAPTEQLSNIEGVDISFIFSGFLCAVILVLTVIFVKDAKATYTPERES